MDSIQGAVLRVKMNYIEAWTTARRAIVPHYDDLLAGNQYGRPASPPHSRHVYHVYAIQLADRNKVQKTLQAAGAGTGIHYPILIHLQKSYANLGYNRGDLPITEALADRFLSLPIYAESEQVAEVVLRLKNACSVDAKQSEIQRVHTLG
jgi:dTDP-4-amino-4,6-dideoxygalactose transaminase